MDIKFDRQKKFYYIIKDGKKLRIKNKDLKRIMKRESKKTIKNRKKKPGKRNIKSLKGVIDGVNKRRKDLQQVSEFDKLDKLLKKKQNPVGLLKAQNQMTKLIEDFALKNKKLDLFTQMKAEKVQQKLLQEQQKQEKEQKDKLQKDIKKEIDKIEKEKKEIDKWIQDNPEKPFTKEIVNTIAAIAGIPFSGGLSGTYLFQQGANAYFKREENQRIRQRIDEFSKKKLDLLDQQYNLLNQDIEQPNYEIKIQQIEDQIKELEQNYVKDSQLIEERQQQRNEKKQKRSQSVENKNLQNIQGLKQMEQQGNMILERLQQNQIMEEDMDQQPQERNNRFQQPQQNNQPEFSPDEKEIIKQPEQKKEEIEEPKQEQQEKLEEKIIDKIDKQNLELRQKKKSIQLEQQMQQFIEPQQEEENMQIDQEEDEENMQIENPQKRRLLIDDDEKEQIEKPQEKQEQRIEQQEQQKEEIIQQDDEQQRIEQQSKQSKQSKQKKQSKQSGPQQRIKEKLLQQQKVQEQQKEQEQQRKIKEEQQKIKDLEQQKIKEQEQQRIKEQEQKEQKEKEQEQQRIKEQEQREQKEKEQEQQKIKEKEKEKQWDRISDDLRNRNILGYFNINLFGGFENQEQLEQGIKNDNFMKVSLYDSLYDKKRIDVIRNQQLLEYIKKIGVEKFSDIVDIKKFSDIIDVDPKTFYFGVKYLEEYIKIREQIDKDLDDLGISSGAHTGKVEIGGKNDQQTLEKVQQFQKKYGKYLRKQDKEVIQDKIKQISQNKQAKGQIQNQKTEFEGITKSEFKSYFYQDIAPFIDEEFQFSFIEQENEIPQAQKNIEFNIGVFFMSSIKDNDFNRHFTVFIHDIPAKQIYYFDPLGIVQNDNFQQYQQKIKNYIENLNEQVKLKINSVNAQKSLLSKGSQFQDENYCSIYSLIFIYRICVDNDSFKQATNFDVLDDEEKEIQYQILKDNNIVEQQGKGYQFIFQ